MKNNNITLAKKGSLDSCLRSGPTTTQGYNMNNYNTCYIISLPTIRETATEQQMQWMNIEKKLSP
jgi:hypothetical protein